MTLNIGNRTLIRIIEVLVKQDDQIVVVFYNHIILVKNYYV